jgi:ATP-dependent Clp protease ATP-binding subunit ClpC
MEEGRLTDSFGRIVDFRNTVVIMTTNAGADEITNRSSLGFSKKDDNATYEKMKDTLKNALERFFRPEFLNRLDDIIVFRQLTRDDLQVIVDIELDKVYKRLAEKGFTLVLSKETREYLIEKGYNVEFGARPLRRAIEQYLEDSLSEELLKGTFQGFDIINAELVDAEGKKQVQFVPSKKESAAPAESEKVDESKAATAAAK